MMAEPNTVIIDVPSAATWVGRLLCKCVDHHILLELITWVLRSETTMRQRLGIFNHPRVEPSSLTPRPASIGIVIGPASVQGGDSRCATVTSFLSGSACPRRRRFQGKPCGLAASILDPWPLAVERSVEFFCIICNVALGLRAIPISMPFTAFVPCVCVDAGEAEGEESHDVLCLAETEVFARKLVGERSCSDCGYKCILYHLV